MISWAETYSRLSLIAIGLIVLPACSQPKGTPSRCNASGIGTNIGECSQVPSNASLSANPAATPSAAPVSLSQSVVTVSFASVLQGGTATVTLTAKDASGNQLTSGGLTVAFFASGGTSTGTISSVTDHGDGTYTATFTGLVAGTATTIQATVGGNAVTSILPTITVTAASVSLSQSILSVSASSIASGSASTITLISKDALGNQLTSGGLTVAFSASGGTSTGTISSVTDHGDGTYTATFTGLVAGTATAIHATIGGSAVTSTSPTITVTLGTCSASNSTVSVSGAPSSIASGGTATLQATIKDGAGNLCGSGQTVTFSFSGGASTGSIGSVTYAGSGVYQATLTGVLAGSASTVNAQLSGSTLGLPMSKPTLSVTPGTLSASNSVISVSAASVASGSTVTATITPKDAAGNLLGSGKTVTVSNSGGTSTGTWGSVTDVGDGTYTAVFTASASGTATTVNANVGGTSVTSTLPTITVTTGSCSASNSTVSVSGAPSSIASGGTATLQATIKDGAGNLCGSGQTVTFSFSGGASTGSIGSVTYAGSGVYQATLTGVLAGSASTVNAQLSGSTLGLPMSKPTLSVTPGTLSASISVVSVSSASVNSGSTVTVTVTPKDAAGNLLGAGKTVTVSNSGGTSTGTWGSVTDVGDGTYTAVFTASTSGTATTVNATIGGTSVTSTLPTITVTTGSCSASNSTVSVSGAPSNIASGGTATLQATIKDGAGNLCGSGQTVTFSFSGGASTGSIGSVTYAGSGVYQATLTGVLAGSASTVNAQLSGSTLGLPMSKPTLSVTPGTLSASNSVISVSAASVASGSTVTATITPKDAAGNLLGSGKTVTVSNSGGTSAGTWGSVTDVGDGTYTAVFTASTSGTATTVNASVGGTAISMSPSNPTITVTVTAPTSLTYSTNPATYILSTAITNNTPSSSGGAVASYSVSPALPSGLSLDTTTGVISGTPSLVTTSATYTVTATNAAGSTQVGVVIAVAASNTAPTITSISNQSVAAGSSVGPLSFTIGDAETPGSLSMLSSSSSNTTLISNANITLGGSGTSRSVTITPTSGQTGVSTITLTVSDGTLTTSTTFTVTVTGKNLEVPIEMVDDPLTSAATATIFNRTQTTLDPSDYGSAGGGETVVYSFEVIAKNAATSGTYSVDLVDASGVSQLSSVVSIPNSSATKRYRVTWTPPTAAGVYRVKLNSVAASKLTVYTARIIVQQTNAARTKLYIPLANGTQTTATSADTYDSSVGFTSSTSFVNLLKTSYWVKNSSAYSALVSGTPWTFEAVLQGSGSVGISAALYDETANAAVAASTVTTTSSTPVVVTASFSNTTSGFVDSDQYSVRIKSASSGSTGYLVRAGLWVKLTDLSKGEVYYRVAKTSSWSATTGNGANQEESRVLLNTALFSTPTFYYELTCGLQNTSPIQIRLWNQSTSDTGTSTATGSLVAGSSVTVSAAPLSRSRSSSFTLSD